MAWLAEQKRKAILQTLHFSQIKEREFSVAEAHNSTLEWILKKKPLLNSLSGSKRTAAYTGLPAKQDLESQLDEVSHRPPEYDSLLEGMGRGE
jgi:hypothetical protein